MLGTDRLSGRSVSSTGTPRGLTLRRILSRGFFVCGCIPWPHGSAAGAKSSGVSRKVGAEIRSPPRTDCLPSSLSPSDRRLGLARDRRPRKGSSGSETNVVDVPHHGRAGNGVSWVSRETGPPASYEVASEAPASVGDETHLAPVAGRRGTTFGSKGSVRLHWPTETGRHFGVETDRQREGAISRTPRLRSARQRVTTTES